MASLSRAPAQGLRHEGFLTHARFRWLIVSILLTAAATWLYATGEVRLEPNGGSWVGYGLGTVSAGLVLWLTALGVRKRAATPGRWSLKGWLSAHVYLGVAVLVTATLHAGFQLGWNVHSAAYLALVIVVASGLFGVTMYQVLPRLLSENRQQATERQMLDAIRALDAQLDAAAQPLAETPAAVVRDSIRLTRIGGAPWRRLTNLHGDCRTLKARRRIRRLRRRATSDGERRDLDAVLELLQRKSAALGLARRHIALRSGLTAWLTIHVPATVALLALLTAHVVSVFFYW